jgi:hypothetical protein
LGGADHNRSLLLAANKSDKENETSHIEKMVPIMNGMIRTLKARLYFLRISDVVSIRVNPKNVDCKND